jgi:hypothetical protein
VSGKPTKLPKSQEQVAFRLPSELVARVDAYAEAIAATVPGVRITRADAVRALLTKALDEHDDRGKRRR